MAAGLLVAFSLVSVPAFKRRDTPGAWSGAPLARVRALIEHRDWESRLALAMERAGWRWSPRRAALTAGAIVCLLGAIGLVIGPAFVPFGLAAGLCVCMMALASTSERRRRRIQGELVPLLELFTLELSGGGSAQSALGSVTVQIEGELAADLRRMLIASQVSGSATFETRLNAYSERLRIPALASLATILAASREFGTGTIQGVRALATDLRRGQRRELIERSRKALNRVLLPAAFGVLLPFLGILMFPAITVLERSLR
ncbi:MAG TPA: hypothetical protein VEW68_08360 [Patescibacteria group bacterium]|nr:hypothetical protein [Patescibacteria group bacterium]